MANRPTAIKYTSFYADLPDNWRKYLNKQDQEGKRKGLLALQKMLSKHDMQIATGALNFAIENGVQDTESILAGYRKITSNTKQLQPLQLKSTIIKMPVFIPDNEKYDHLIGQEVLS